MKQSNQFWTILCIILLSFIINITFSLYTFKENQIESRKREITSILHFAQAQVSMHIDKQKKGLLSKDQAESAVIDALSAMNNGSSYIWCNDHQAIARVHSRSEVVGKYQRSYTANMAQLKNKDIIFLLETNVKPISDKRVWKINGVMKIPEWDWVVGYGVYMDTLEEEFLDTAFKSIAINLLLVILILGFIALFTRLKSTAQDV